MSLKLLTTSGQGDGTAKCLLYYCYLKSVAQSMGLTPGRVQAPEQVPGFQRGLAAYFELFPEWKSLSGVVTTWHILTNRDPKVQKRICYS